MPGTYSQLLMHIVFSTKHRERWIAGEVAERLYPYMGGIIRSEKGSLLEIGGVADHVHLLIRWRPDESVSSLMRIVKSRSSLWIHQTFAALTPFAWQEGYSAFSVSKVAGGCGQSVHHQSAAASCARGLQERIDSVSSRARDRVR